MIYHEHIGFGDRSGAAFITLDKSGAAASYAPKTDAPTNIKTEEDERSARPWAEWGTDNLLPLEMVKDIENCGVLNAAIDGKARFGLGRGPKPFKVTKVNKDGSEELEPIVDAEIEDWMEESDMFNNSLGWFKDQIAFHNACARFKFTRDGKRIGLAWRHDVTEMRYEKKNKRNIIDNLFFSAQWDRISDYEKNSDKIIKVPLLPSVGPFAFLNDLDESKRKSKEFAFVSRNPGWNRHYYSSSTWYAARKWVKIAQSVPEMKAAIFNNNIRIKYLVIIQETYWQRTHKDWNNYTPEVKRQKTEDLWDKIDQYLAGAENAGKSIFMTGWMDPITQQKMQDIEIKVIEDSTKQGEYLPDSAAANSEILFALMMNPALMGADTPGGPYSGGAGSGSNIREAALVQVMIQELERQWIGRILNIVKKMNGWKKEIVWRFPGLVLTTLDTGKSTKPVTTGG
jgi:hypothetical protein